MVSSIVVTNGPLIKAGSSFKCFKPIGNKVPKVTATIVLVAITTPAIKATHLSWGLAQIRERATIVSPKATAVPKPAKSSLRRIFPVSAGVTSPTPKPRMVTVRAWIPTVPPVLENMGIITARTGTAAITS